MSAEYGVPEVDGGSLGWSDGLLVRIVVALRDVADGGLLAITSARPDVGEGLAAWSRMTGNAIVASEPRGAGERWVVRKGAAKSGEDASPRPIGSRIWLYTNFDCNLACDYCCVRSSPRAEKRALGLERIRRIATEARGLGVEALFLTGGEPLMAPDIWESISACADAAPTTILTNGMLIAGPRLERLRALAGHRDRVVLQISVDSPTSELHDLHRGAGSWQKALRGVRAARDLGFRVRLAATVSTDADEERFRAFLSAEGVAEEDRVIRRVALRGVATEGVALAQADLMPEVTLTDGGVYWHPVGAQDNDFLVSRDLFPLAAAVEAVRTRWEEIRQFHDRLASVFHCA